MSLLRRGSTLSDISAQYSAVEMSMAAFLFTVNKSFLRDGGQHPITIPRGQVDYRRFEQEGLSSEDLTVVFPRGERFKGKLHHGEAGRGEYYQLWLPGRLPAYVRTGEDFVVAIFRIGTRTFAVLEYLE